MDDRAGKLHVLWNKGRNMYASFFRELTTIRKEIGDEQKFADWCFYDLRISVSILHHVSDVLTKADARILREELSAARKLDREKKRAGARPPDAARTGDVARLKAEVARLTEENARLKLARSKAGRKPIGDRPMTAAERMARMRAKRY